MMKNRILKPIKSIQTVDMANKVVCCYDNKYTKSVQIYRGENAVYKFIENMLEEVKYCKKIIKYKFNKPLKMTKEYEQDFQKS